MSCEGPPPELADLSQPGTAWGTESDGCTTVYGHSVALCVIARLTHTYDNTDFYPTVWMRDLGFAPISTFERAQLP